MDIYKINTAKELIAGNPYVGRGIVAGLSENGRYAVAAYFIMGRSANSRNRVFVKKGNDLYTEPYDPSKVEDPSLIIYAAVRERDGGLIVTNGDQTDTIYDGIASGKSFEESLECRRFEPDAPNFTPRISADLSFEDGFSYKMSILKSIDAEGTDCARFSYSFPAKSGLGHFIHTYVTDGAPIPTFQGEPERIAIPNDIGALADELWTSLDENNKISLFVRYIDLENGKSEDVIINKNK